MSDSSEDEDLSKFREAVDNSFMKLLNDSPASSQLSVNRHEKPPKSERYLEESSHYNDVKFPKELQQRVGDKISTIINKKIQYIDVENNNVKKHKIKGGVKLFKDSEQFLSCEEAMDISTLAHNKKCRKIKNGKKFTEDSHLSEEDKIKAVAVTGEYVISKEEIKCWKSRRKEKLFKYKATGKGKVLTAVE